MNWIKKSIIISILLVASISTIAAQQDSADRSDGSVLKWQKLADGLELGVFLSPQRADYGDSLIRVLRIDPQFFELKLLNASSTKEGRPLTTKQWCRQEGLVAAINASMYQADHKTSV